MSKVKWFTWREFEIMVVDKPTAYEGAISFADPIGKKPAGKGVRIHKNPASPIRLARALKLAGEQLHAAQEVA